MNRNFTIISIIVFFTLSIINAETDKQKNESKYPKVSIHAQDTHLPSILAILAEESGYNIVTGPNVVKTVTHENVTMESLGGAKTHAEKSGVAHFIYENEKKYKESKEKIEDI